MYFVARDVERDPPETGSESEALRDGDLTADKTSILTLWCVGVC